MTILQKFYIILYTAAVHLSTNGADFDNNANYFSMMNTYVKTFTGFSSLVDATSNVLATGENTVEFVFETKSDYNRAINELENNAKFFNFVEKSVTKSGRNLSKTSVLYNNVDRYYYLCIQFKEG